MVEGVGAGPSGASPPAGIGVIVAYKAAKATVELAAVAGLMAFAVTGEGSPLVALARDVKIHLASHWAVAFSHGLHAMGSRHGVHLLEGGLAVDALLTALEGWSLWKGYWWGAWLVIGATLLPLPWELWGLLHRGGWTRLALTAVNLSIAGYLARRVVRGHPPRAGTFGGRAATSPPELAAQDGAVEDSTASPERRP